MVDQVIHLAFVVAHGVSKLLLRKRELRVNAGLVPTGIHPYPSSLRSQVDRVQRVNTMTCFGCSASSESLVADTGGDAFATEERSQEVRLGVTDAFSIPQNLRCLAGYPVALDVPRVRYS